MMCTFIINYLKAKAKDFGVHESVYLEWNLPCLALCSWRIRVFSSFTGLGMKPISQPSFTRRPIHQSLLYFYTYTKFKKVISNILLFIAAVIFLSIWHRQTTVLNNTSSSPL